MEVTVVELVKRMLRIFDEVPQPKIVVWISNPLTANLAYPMGRLSSLQCFSKSRIHFGC